MHQYLMLEENLLTKGIRKEDRTGTGTLSNFGNQHVYDIWDNKLAAVTTRKIHMPTNIVELIWMLSGDTNVKFLKDNNCNIWDEWVDPDTAKYRDRTVAEMRKQFERKFFGFKVVFAMLEDGEVAHVSMDTGMMDASAQGAEPQSFATYHAAHETVWPMVEDKNHENWLTFYELAGISRFEVTEGELGSVYGKMLRDIEDVRFVECGPFDFHNAEERLAAFTVFDDKLKALKRRGFEVRQRTVLNATLRRRIDQVKELQHRLQHDPDSRRLILCIWNPAYQDEQALPPCHSFIQFYTRLLAPEERYALYAQRADKLQADVHKRACENPEEPLLNMYTHVVKISRDFFKTEEELVLFLDSIDVPKRAISCMFTMRSNDVYLGMPYNLIFYSLLTHMLAHQFNMVGEKLVYSSGDAHLYTNHVEQAKIQLSRTPMQSPTVRFNPLVKDILAMKIEDITVENYFSHAHIPAPVAI